MIRVATRADLPRISAIRMAVRENVLSRPEKITATVEHLIDRDGFWVFEEAGAILGFSSADPRDGSIFALFIDPAHEGRGAGQALIAAACASLARAGHAVANLSTEEGTRADRFYRQNGWTDVGRTDSGEVIFQKPIG
ncbi:MAG: GNAT family N-acetyltransferase [Phreatobacter sp.]|uniref:GNAT family N-acetyltransferase n=1 Tax=Phreatobacter sp. TaxID=1966341 RepID=UPI001A4A52D0|nr:GNAT family N-acetyltransferase [Phreatobacter sp.]MBL8569265.1 GNAT family N-acetyltransferase [Phreatobacter sp.]